MNRLPASRLLRDWPLRLVALANLAFILAFAVVLLLATSQARAEAPVCEGKDMIAEMARDRPDLLEKVKAAAAAEPNARGLLWRVEKDGVAPSYLFGTMHVTDPRVTTLPEPAKQAFDAADTVVIETLDMLDEQRMTTVLLGTPDLMMFTDGRSLDTLIPEADRAMVAAALDERGMPLSAVRKTKPWIVSALLAMPQCELDRQAADVPVLDLKLAEDAKAAGKHLEGLESAREQFDAITSLSMDFHIEGLVETARVQDRIADISETMVSIYRSGELGLFWPFFSTVFPESAADEGYSAFQHSLITVRNRTMAERAVPILDKGGAFVAVGALHLPGREGVVALLTRSGYRLTEVE